MIDTSIVGVQEAASLLGLTDSRVRQLLGKGDLAGQKLNARAWAVPVAEIHRFRSVREKQSKGPGRPAKNPPAPIDGDSR